MGFPKIALRAVETLYPAGAPAWSGQPIKVPPAGDYWLPNTRPPAENMNWIENQFGIMMRTAVDSAASAAIANYDTPIGVSAIDASAMSLAFVAWHPFRQTWLAVNNIAGPNFSVCGSTSSGRAWTVETSLIGAYVPHALWADPASIFYQVFLNGMAGTGFMTNAGVFTSVPGLGTVGSTSVLYARGSGLAFVGLSAGGGTYACYYATSPTLGGAWTMATASLPAAWQTGAGNFTQLVSATSDATDALGPRTLIALAGTTAGTDGSRMLLVSAGGSFTDLGTTPLPIAAGGGQRTARAIAYSPNDGLWGMLVTDGASSYLYTSLDPASGAWTLAHTFTGMTEAGGLACVGSLWSAQARSATEKRILYSNDVATLAAASTWSTASFFWTGTYVPGGLACSGNQIVSFNTSSCAFSKLVGPMGQGQF